MRSSSLLLLAITFISFIYSPIDTIADDAEQTADSEPGVSITATLTNDTQGVVAGGIKKKAVSTSLMDIVGDISTEKIGLWKGGKFHVDTMLAYGGNINAYSGVYQGASSITAPDTFGLFEAYYEHEFNDAQWRIAVGVQNHNVDFYFSEYAGTLLNPSAGMGPELSQLAPSTYPSTAFGVAIKGKPTDGSYSLLGIYDGIAGHSDGVKGTHFGQHSGDGYYMIQEFGLIAPEETTDQDYYKLGIGSWQKTTNFVDFNGNSREFVHGFYSIVEKSLYHEADTAQGLGAFMQTGFTRGDRLQANTYFGAGLSYTGLFCDRDEDVTALGIYRAGISNDYKKSNPGTNREETILELTYQAKINDWMSIQPDLQFAHNPGATAGVHDAWIMGLRTQLSF
jgi:porin